MNIANHPAQRVGIFIDTQNLYHSAKINYKANVNYEAVIEAAVAGRNLIRAFAYVIKAESDYENKFFEALENIGIETKIKDIQIFHTGEKKADWDVGIAVDIIRMTEKLDTVILMSGDGDFVEVIKYVQSRGVRAEVFAFEKTASQKLIDEVDAFYDLGAAAKHFLIGGYAARSPRTSTKSGTTRAVATNEMHRTQANSSQYQSPAFMRKQQAAGYDHLFGKKTGRDIKPVAGTPAKKPIVTTRTNRNPSAGLDNVFGNSPEKLKKSRIADRMKKNMGGSDSMSSVFKF